MDYPLLNCTLYGPSGEALSGEDTLSSFMKEHCDEVGGYILNKAGDTIYPQED